MERTTDGRATALHTFRADGFRKRCAYCQEEHKEERCEKVKDFKIRKNIARKYGRCFTCMKKGHRVVECRSKSLCKVCNGKHHVSLCEWIKELHARKDPTPAKPTAPPAVDSMQNSTNITSCTNSLGLGHTSSVALQTGRAIVNGNQGNEARVLFDSGSQRTFVTAQVVDRPKIRVMGKEILGTRGFRSAESERKLRDVVELDLRAI